MPAGDYFQYYKIITK